MQKRACSADCSFNPAIIRLQYNALPAKLWRTPSIHAHGFCHTVLYSLFLECSLFNAQQICEIQPCSYWFFFYLTLVKFRIFLSAGTVNPSRTGFTSCTASTSPTTARSAEIRLVPHPNAILFEVPTLLEVTPYVRRSVVWLVDSSVG